MEEYYIECSPGISGDMLLGALNDLGVPLDVIEEPLISLGLENFYNLSFNESKSLSIRGIQAKIEVLDNSHRRDWRSIKEFILKGSLKSELEKNIIGVFQTLAEAEAKVHGIDPDEVHFHEIGSIDSIIDIVGVCAGFHYLRPKFIYSNTPTLGKGFVQTEHGKMSIPSPAVIELVARKKMTVYADSDLENGELATPTGIALLLTLVNSFETPSKYFINSYGVGLGSRKFSFPNLTRILNISSFNRNLALSDNKFNSPKFQEICIQEAWIDDQSSEDISSFVEILREKGALDVSYNPINMKKGRVGYSMKVILPIEKEEYFRDLWFSQTSTIGLRERRQGRWTLLRRKGQCQTSFGKLNFKQVIKLNGEIKLKPENDEIKFLQKKYNKSADEIRSMIDNTKGKFIPFEEWE
tara:strand:+ start:9454 stop:10686 length:1233 start_codon:yes stop_codon:yes gene_type:complete